jgi:hypothetical protein
MVNRRVFRAGFPSGRSGESNDKVGEIAGNGIPLAIDACRLEKNVEKK